jgi:hypothetical protein
LFIIIFGSDIIVLDEENLKDVGLLRKALNAAGHTKILIHYDISSKGDILAKVERQMKNVVGLGVCLGYSGHDIDEKIRDVNAIHAMAVKRHHINEARSFYHR